MTYPDLRVLPPGDAGAFQTLAWLSQAAKHAAATFPGACLWPNLAPMDRARALRGWLVRFTEYQDDPPGAELARHPSEMLEALTRGEDPIRGDCDDVAALGATLALVCQLRVRWRLLRFGPGAPYGHVYAEVKPQRGGEWLDLDVTRPAALPGLMASMVRTSDPIPLD